MIVKTDCETDGALHSTNAVLNGGGGTLQTVSIEQAKVSILQGCQ